jgi:hypothetical protein
MARRSSLYSQSNNKETRTAERIAKILTEDFSIDLERVGYYLVRNLPRIVYHRFDVLALTAMEESDKLEEEMRKSRELYR